MTALARFVVVAVALAAAVAPVAADTKADTLFKKGKKLLGEGKFAEACAAFEASQREEPTIGTQLNIARCYEEWGKLSTAYNTYVDALAQAETDGDDRAARIKERIATIEPTVPTLVIRADSRPVNLVVRLDGKDLAVGELGASRRLDPGEHVIDYGVGEQRKRIKLTLEPSQHETVTLEKLAAMQVGGPVEEGLEPDDEPEAPPADPHPGRTRRILGIGVGGAGVVMLGITTWIVLDARADYRAALAAHCNADKMCDDVGLDATHAARHRANVGTVLFSVGLAAVAGGVVLYLTAPKGSASAREHARWRVTPVVTPDATGLVLSGGF